MKKYGLIGNPVKGSLSPLLFKAAYGGKYGYDLIEGASFEASWRLFLDSYDAINITAPFKEDAFAQAVCLAKDGMGSVSGPCLRTGAANIAVRHPEGIEVLNSDFPGIIMSVADQLFPGVVRECYMQFPDKGHIKVHQFIRDNLSDIYGGMKPQALIIGAGGAGKAAALAAAEMGFAAAVMNRTASKAASLAASLQDYGVIAVPSEDIRDAILECELVIYTVPVAAEGLQDGLSESAPDCHDRKIILEANYRTPVLEGICRQNGWRYISGKRWLLWQAVAGYGAMTGEIPDFEAMQAAIEKV